jgi:endoglycosylceramidase
LSLHRCRRWFALAATLVVAVVFGCRFAGHSRPVPIPPAPASASAGPARLRVEGRHFVADDGRVVLLRGVNLSGDSKVPPFNPIDDPAQLDPLPAMGCNAVRLQFVWEAYEPDPGVYDESYLARMVEVADACGARGLYVIIDIHQDGFSRYSTRGCGAGFPSWAVSPRARLDAPDNGCDCKEWFVKLVTDPGFFKSSHDFYADVCGVRARFLTMLGRVAAGFAASPAVVGYDLLNEPWADEVEELAPLHADEAAAIRAAHPAAILFVAGHASTGNGFQTRLPRPCFDNFAYAPHYYMPLAMALEAWPGNAGPIDRAFANMESKAVEWGVPLFVGEYGIAAGARRGGDYVAAVLDDLDAVLGSGAQWTYTPHWTPQRRDGWNMEDFSFIDDRLRPRANYCPRPCALKVAGIPGRFHYQEPGPPGCPPARMEFAWDAVASLGATEVFLPSAIFPPGSAIDVVPTGTECVRDEARQLLLIRVPADGPACVTLTAP